MEQAGPAFNQTVSEADIDWILCIELNSDPHFRDWFGRAVFGVTPKEHQGTWRSISDPILGESDLIWVFLATDGCSRMALIENKVHARAQPTQYERYVLRGQQSVEKGYCKEFRTVLISPEAYESEDSHNYEVHISYESLQSWFNGHDGERPKFLASIFADAITKFHTTGPQLIDREMSVFRKKYFAFFQEFFQDQQQHVTMQAPKDSWKGGCWFFIHSSLLPRGAYINHKSPFGFVDLTFRSTDATRLKALEPMLEDDMKVHQTHRSAAIRLVVSQISQFSDFEQERPKIAEAFAGVKRLLNFYTRERVRLEAVLTSARTEMIGLPTSQLSPN
ncbi:MAG: hypothetical protein ABSD63_17930 [Candidatus Korobacteraceae bacterium]|jgi:hypothetical protein